MNTNQSGDTGNRSLNVLTPEYLEQMQAHIDEGGTLSHKNAIELLAEVKRLREPVMIERQILRQIMKMIHSYKMRGLSEIHVNNFDYIESTLESAGVPYHD